MLPVGTTVASLQAQLASQRAALALAAAGAAAAAGSYSASTDMLGALAALVEAMRAGMTDPAGQVRVLLGLAGFTFVDGAGGAVGVGAAMATMRDAMAAACRRAALISLARASAAYQPVSYDDAAALRAVLSAALDAEITTAGDAGDDAAYGALKTLRSAVVRDLTVRGASLPTVVTVVLAQPMPALAIAQLLYRDASRADEIAAESGAPHPAFCPVSFKVLTSGLGRERQPDDPGGDRAGCRSGVVIAPRSASGPYHAPPPPPLPPGAPLGLTIIEPATTRTSVSLTWTAPTWAIRPIATRCRWGRGPGDGHGGQLRRCRLGRRAAHHRDRHRPGHVHGLRLPGLCHQRERPGRGVGHRRHHDARPRARTRRPASAASTGTPAETVMVVTWTASAIDGSHDAAAAYTVYYRQTGASSFLPAAPGWISGTSAAVTGLTAGTSYDFEVVASNWGGGAVSGW